MLRSCIYIRNAEVVGIHGDDNITRVKIYNGKTNRLNLKSCAHVRFLIEKLLVSHLFEGVYIKDAQAVIGLLKLVITCLENEQQELLEKTVRDLEQQLQTSTS